MANIPKKEARFDQTTIATVKSNMYWIEQIENPLRPTKALISLVELMINLTGIDKSSERQKKNPQKRGGIYHAKIKPYYGLQERFGSNSQIHANYKLIEPRVVKLSIQEIKKTQFSFTKGIYTMKIPHHVKLERLVDGEWKTTADKKLEFGNDDNKPDGNYFAKVYDSFTKKKKGIWLKK